MLQTEVTNQRCLSVSHRPTGSADETLGWQTQASFEHAPAGPSVASLHIAYREIERGTSVRSLAMISRHFSMIVRACCIYMYIYRINVT